MKKQTGILLSFLVIINVLTAYVISTNMMNSYQFKNLNLSFTLILVISFFTLILGVLIDLVIVNIVIKITLKIFNYSINKKYVSHTTIIYILILSCSNLIFNMYFLSKGIYKIQDMQIPTYLNPFIYISSLFVLWILNKRCNVPMKIASIVGFVLVIYKFLSNFILNL